MGSIEHISRVTDLRVWPGEIPVSHLYTMGIAGERFLREIKDHGRFLATRCGACEYTYLPPSLFCQRCFDKLEEWREVGPGGLIRAHTVVHIDLEGRRLDTARVLALVQMDGADGLLAHWIDGAPPQAIEDGLRVTAVLKEPAERVGSILDVSHFRPV